MQFSPATNTRPAIHILFVAALSAACGSENGLTEVKNMAPGETVDDYSSEMIVCDETWGAQVALYVDPQELRDCLGTGAGGTAFDLSLPGSLQFTDEEGCFTGTQACELLGETFVQTLSGNFCGDGCWPTAEINSWPLPLDACCFYSGPSSLDFEFASALAELVNYCDGYDVTVTGDYPPPYGSFVGIGIDGEPYENQTVVVGSADRVECDGNQPPMVNPPPGVEYVMLMDPTLSTLSLTMGGQTTVTPLSGIAHVATQPARVLLASAWPDDATLGSTQYTDWRLGLSATMALDAQSGAFTVSGQGAPLFFGRGFLDAEEYVATVGMGADANGQLDMTQHTWYLDYSQPGTNNAVSIHMQGTFY